MMIAAARAYRLPVVIYGQESALKLPVESAADPTSTAAGQFGNCPGPEAYQELRTWGFDETRLCLGADPVYP